MNIPQTLVLDTSVLLQPLLQEEGATKVAQLLYLKDNFKLSILVPDIFRYEFFNTATRKKNAMTARRAYQALTEKQLSIIPLEFDLLEACNRFMEKYQGISFYDAAYHALAKAYNCPFITADKKYYEHTKKEGTIELLENIRLKDL